jgi:HEAT repeat protein
MRRDGGLFTGAVVALGGWLGAGGPSVCPLPVPSAHAASRAGVIAASAAQEKTFDEHVLDLRSSDPDVRLGALRALAASGFPEAIAPMSVLLADPIDEIQIEAIDYVLGYYVVDPPRTTRRVGLVFEVRKRADARSLFEEGPFIVIPRPVPAQLSAGLAGAIQDATPYIRIQAIYAAGVVLRPPIDPVTAEVLTGALRDSVAEIRMAAAQVLGTLRVTSAGEALIGAVNDESPDVKNAAMRALGDIRELRAIQALGEQFAFYERGTLAEASFDGLARIGHPVSVPLFQQQLSNKDWVMRRFAAEGLARTRSPDVVAAIEPRFEREKKAQVQLAMAYALAAAGRPAVKAVADTLGDAALAPQAMAYLVDLGRPIVPSLTPYLRSSSADVRERTAMVLGLIGGAEAVAALESVGQDSEVRVARAVERAVARAMMTR